MKLYRAIYHSFFITVAVATDTSTSSHQDQEAVVSPKLKLHAPNTSTQGKPLRQDVHRKLFDSLPKSQIHALLSDDISTKGSYLRARAEEGPVTKNDASLDLVDASKKESDGPLEEKGISMMDLESLLSSNHVIHPLKLKVGEDGGVGVESDSGRGSQCIWDNGNKPAGENSWYHCPEDYPKCVGYGGSGRPGRCSTYLGDLDVNYKKDYFTISIKLHNRDLFLSASNLPLNNKRSKHVHFMYYDQSTQEGRDSLAEDYFAHWRFENPKDVIGNGQFASCELDDCRLVINRGKGMPLAVHKGPLQGSGRSDWASIDDPVGVLVTPLMGLRGELEEDAAAHYSHYTMMIHRRYPDTTWRLYPNLRPHAKVNQKPCAYPSFLHGKGHGTYKCPGQHACVGYQAHVQWGKCYQFWGGGNHMNDWENTRGGFEVKKKYHDDNSDCDPWQNESDCYYYLKVTKDRTKFASIQITKLTADPPRDVNDMGAASYDHIAELSDSTRDLAILGATGAASLAGMAVGFPGAGMAVGALLNLAWSDNSQEKALKKLAQQVLEMAYEQSTSEIARNNVQNGNDSLSLARVGFLIAYTAMRDKYVKDGNESNAYFFDDLQLLVVKLESIIDTHNQGISIYLSNSDYDMYDTVTVKTAQTGFKLLKLSYMELILMVQELTGLHSYVRVKRGESFSCNELVEFVKKISLFENTNSVLTNQKNMLYNRRIRIMNGQSPWYDWRVDGKSSTGSRGYSMDRFYQGEDKTHKKFYETTDNNSDNMREKATYLYKEELQKEMRSMQHYDIAGELQALDDGRASLVNICEKVKATPDWFKNG